MKFLLAFVAVCLGLWAFVHFAFPDYSHRFRLTIEIETPDGVKASSSVMQSTRIDYGYLPLPGRGSSIELKGDAVFIDLGPGQNVIAVLGFGPRGDDVDQIGVLALKAWGLDLTAQGWADVRTRQGQANLVGDLIPTLVTFSDPSDPRSAQVVYATAIVETNDGRTGPRRRSQVLVDRLAELLGPQTSFRSARIEMTNAPVTRGIGNKLRWLPHPRYLSGQYACGQNEPHCLHGEHFAR